LESNQSFTFSDDIIYVLRPTFTQSEIDAFDNSSKFCRAYDGTTYLPGIVGLNNIKANDYCNVILQALSHVPPIRNYFLEEKNYCDLQNKKRSGDNLYLIVQRFGELLRKLWNPRNFKAHVSPHEMLQAVVLCSNKKFQITEQSDPVEFLSWFLNSLHIGLNGSRKENSSIVYKTFRGLMKVHSRKVIPLDKSIDEKLQLMLKDEYKEKCKQSNFLYLTLDLPPPPLFKDEMRENIIPQVPLYTLLTKFNGVTEKEYKSYKESMMKRFELVRLPKYLILYMKRFTKNTFYIEKNPTIVNFPIKNVDFTELLSAESKAHYSKCIYDLIANVVHDGDPEPTKGSYRIHVLHRGSGKWFEMQDLHVTEILPQMITLSESYIQIWEAQNR
jgi:U4/U6.U5 tri-snRNP-associated protein, putative